jgi:hypothetical protein
MKTDNEFLPNFEEPEPPLAQLIDFVDQEVKYRRKRYPILIERGSLKSQQAWKKIHMMEAVRKRLETLKT